MQALIVTLLLFSQVAFAKDDKSLVLEVLSETHWGKSWTKVHSEKNKWWCETDASPRHDTEKKPFDEEKLQVVLENSEVKKTCTHAFSLRFLSGKKPRSVSGCVEDPLNKPFFDDLGRSCGR